MCTLSMLLPLCFLLFQRGALCPDITPTLAIHTNRLVAKRDLPLVLTFQTRTSSSAEEHEGLSFRFTKMVFLPHLPFFKNRLLLVGTV